MDTVDACLYRNNGISGYEYTDGHSYSITEIDKYNRESTEYLLFESESGLLKFSFSDEEIIYGIANEDWWTSNIDQSQKQRYTITVFRNGNVNFVLYSRLVKNNISTELSTIWESVNWVR
ncbi:MAG: hypothetical protein LBR54_02610 [Oscillospiraceae bacterium]|jgi:hypothetical protein|nr:hypothetical protein [Oscillospiraceae bacterium]